MKVAKSPHILFFKSTLLLASVTGLELGVIIQQVHYKRRWACQTVYPYNIQGTDDV